MRNECDLLKVMAILLVVLGHTTILHSGHGAFADVEPSAALAALTKGIYLFHMPLFIALSGAIFAYGADRGKYAGFVPFLRNKASRILVPFLFVGSCVLMPTLEGTGLTRHGAARCLAEIFVGGGDCKHLWYLPAIFWCFMAAWCQERLRVPLALSVPLALGAAVAWMNLVGGNWLQLLNGLQYLPAFLVGMWLMRSPLRAGRAAPVCAAAFVLLKVGIAVLPAGTAWVQLCCILLPLPVVAALFAAGRQCWGRFAGIGWMRLVLRDSFAIYLFHVPALYWLYCWLRHALPVPALIPLAFSLSIAASVLLAAALRRLRLQALIGEK